MIRRHKWAALLALWTLGIWGSRLRNALADDALVGGERAQALVIAAGFVLLAAAVGIGTLRKTVWAERALIILVVAGVLRWTIRGPIILVSSEWEVGFKVVHTVLWVVTVVLSVMAWREASSLKAEHDVDPGYDSGHGSARLRH